jgi:hypothetical protein
MTHFKRPQLASAIADELIGKSSFSDAPNGLFLAAARRTGKSEFLKQDLQPALEDRGILVVYVDLWADKKRSPMDLIASELGQAVNKSMGVVAKLAVSTGMDSLTVAGIKIDTSKIGKTDGMTLHKVLSLIHQQTGKTIALIIDEAQHALTTEDGDATMSALKSARDQMRDNGQAGLMLVMSGSHRDKLMKLLNTAAAPFWGSQVRPLPTLGTPFVEQIANDLRRQRPELLSLDAAALNQAFSLCGERPQFFFGILGEALDSSTDAPSFSQRVRELAQAMRARDRDGLSQIYLSLALLEQAVLWRLMDQNAEFHAFDAAALAFYATRIGKKVTAAQAQKAINNLRDNEPPLVWRSLRGEYSLYDLDMLDWYTYLNSQHAWPPVATAS